MKNLYLYVWACLCLPLSVFSQSTASLSAQLTSSEAKPLGFASAYLHRTADSSLVKTALSDEAGHLLMTSLAPGTYLLEIRYVGMQSLQKELTLEAGAQKDLGKLTLFESGTQLEAVDIVAERPLLEVKPDKTVFNVSGTVNAIGTNALELLKKSPGVVVDNNDNILLMGKSGVRIYIDGKPSPLSTDDLAALLKSMESSQIESIEIITQPTAQYDAEGNAGIINIKMKKDQNLGANGSLGLGYAVGTYSKYNGSATVNYRNADFNAYGNYSLGKGLNQRQMNLYRIQSGTEIDQKSTTKDDYESHNFKGGADFFLGKKHTVGLMVNGFITDWTFRNRSRAPITDILANQPLSVLVASSDNFGDRNNVNGNLNYQFDNEKGVKWNLDLDYGWFQLNTDSHQPNFYMDPTETEILNERIFGTETPTDIDIYSFKADHERPLLGGQLIAGVKLSQVATDNTFNFFDVIEGDSQLNSERSNRFSYDENIHAAYAQYQRKVNKWDFMAGLRMEHTHSDGRLESTQQTNNDRVERDYVNFFPSAGMTYQLNPKNTLKLNYSRRIDRPRYQNLNPFEFKLDELTYQRGNPFLRPQYTHNIQLSHTFNYRLNTSLSYSVTDDYFTQITDTFQTNSTFITEENLATRTVWSMNVSYPFSPVKWWSVYSNLTVFHSRNEADFGEGKEIDMSQSSFNFYQQQNFQVAKGFSIQLSGFYNSPAIWGANYRNREMWGIDGGIQKSLFKGKANLRVSVSDIFHTMQWGGTQEFGDLFMRAGGRWESRQLKINLTYNFGNQKVKAERKRSSGLEDERSRVGEGN